jgi:hypothetical protein
MEIHITSDEAVECETSTGWVKLIQSCPFATQRVSMLMAKNVPRVMAGGTHIPLVQFAVERGGYTTEMTAIRGRFPAQDL